MSGARRGHFERERGGYGGLTGLRLAEVHAAAILRDGREHVHDIRCATWRGNNWVGGCDCRMASRGTR